MTISISFIIPHKGREEFLIKTIGLMPETSTRKNIGKAGRGDEILNDEQKSKILSLANSWKIKDESLKLIGIN